jgi:periplasmic divalent cation tolerance protein
MDVRVVLCTCPNAEVAAAIAHTVVTESLAACANLIPGVRSIYRWEGRVCDDAEVLMVLKTTGEVLEPLRARLVALHPYACPEVLALPVDFGHLPYLSWVRAQVSAPSR